jgi:hypothetical protein
MPRATPTYDGHVRVPGLLYIVANQDVQVADTPQALVCEKTPFHGLVYARGWVVDELL